MNKFLFSFLFLFTSITIFSQEDKQTFKKHFVNIRAGYSIPVSKSQIGSPRVEVGNTFIDKTSKSYSEKNSFGSRGAGLNFSLAYGYMITENISIELDFSYIHTLGITDAYNIETNSVKDTLYFGKQTSHTSMFRATPLIGIYASKNLLIRPYAKFGLIVPFYGYTYAKLHIQDKSSASFESLMPLIDFDAYKKTKALLNTFPVAIPVPTKTFIEAKSEGTFSLGFDARLGAEYNLGDIFVLFAEMNMQMLTVKTKKTIITKFTSTVDDETLKSIADASGIKTVFTELDLPEIIKVTEYLDELNGTENDSYAEAIADIIFNENSTTYKYKDLVNKPLQELNFRDNYNAFGFILGVKMVF